MADNINVFIYSEPSFAKSIKNKFHSPNIKVVGTANDMESAKQSITRNSVDITVLVLSKTNLESFELMAGFLKSKSFNFIVVCENVKEGFSWLKRGAMDMVVAPRGNSESDIRLFINNLDMKVKNFKKTLKQDIRVLKNDFAGDYNKIIAIGSSTGGTEAVFSIIKSLPANSPPVLIVQHMPPVFTKLYAERMHNNCKMSVWEAHDGDVLKKGLALIAPGEFQMKLNHKGNGLSVNCFEAPKRNGHCPSVDVLFDSIAELGLKNTIGIILTGMGNDGAQGLLKMRGIGCKTIGQDEESSVVYGMPKVAFTIGGVEKQAHLKDIPSIILGMI